jgi:threonine synthase
VGAAEGLFLAPEGAACCVALSKLRQSEWIQAHESVVVFNTGAGLKYLECYTELK